VFEVSEGEERANLAEHQFMSHQRNDERSCRIRLFCMFGRKAHQCGVPADGLDMFRRAARLAAQPAEKPPPRHQEDSSWAPLLSAFEKTLENPELVPFVAELGGQLPDEKRFEFLNRVVHAAAKLEDAALARRWVDAAFAMARTAMPPEKFVELRNELARACLDASDDLRAEFRVESQELPVPQPKLQGHLGRSDVQVVCQPDSLSLRGRLKGL